MVIALAAALAAEAAQVKIVAEPPQLVAGQSGTVRVQVVFDGSSAGVLDTGRPPPVPVGQGLRIAFVGQGSQFRSVNGRISRSFDLQYRVTAVEEGTWPIGPVDVALADGTTVSAPAIQLTVGQRVATPEDEQFQISADFATPLAWEGQVVPYKLSFTSRVPGASVRWTLPDFEGLRQLGEPRSSQYTVDDPDGRITVAESVIALVAAGTGDRDQDPATAIVQIPVGPSDIFGLRRVREQAYPTKKAVLQVKPLPPAPAGFSGLVGDFVVRSEVGVKGDQVAVGQSIPWTLTVSGDGALEGVALPAYAAPHTSVYDSGSDVVGRLDDQRYTAVGTWQRVIVPTEVGELDLPDLSLVTFSPTEGRYVTHTIDLPRLTVVEGREGNGEVQSFSAAGDEAASDPVAIDLRPIYTWGRATAPRLAAVLPPMVGLAAFPGLAVGLAGLVGRLRERRRARAEAEARPPTASEVLRDLPADPDERLAALDAALRIAEARSLETRGERDARVLQLRARLGRIRFGGDAPDPTIEDDVRRLVDAIEKETA